jgi:hypothetical protein
MIISSNSLNHLISLMVNCGVLFETWAVFLNMILVSVSFKGLDQLNKVFENAKG